MLIGALSRRTGVRTHQLRYYEAQGLLKPDRGPTGYREYGSDAVTTVAQIRNLLAAGLSTAEIAAVLPCAAGPTPDFEPCEELAETFARRLADLDARMTSLAHARDLLRGFVEVTRETTLAA
ncbi:MerR family transcriptional regulator [Microlunatus sp. Y2014]|uniref:MerR family transcriptional regulator n=1 Tax=Microlunatus sp. Y2014 TaxID=3418488 RepID=UPI003DA6FB5A